jgi:formylglycine-generating enzyme required for sulfatase activity
MSQPDDLQKPGEAHPRPSILTVPPGPQTVADPYATLAPEQTDSQRPQGPTGGDQTLTARQDLAAGTAAGGAAAGQRYRILRLLGRGGLGEVFVAQDQELQREVALKEIQVQFCDSPESRSRFLLEAEVTGRLEHPGVVPVYGLGTYPDGRPFYAMRFICGHSMQEAIDQYHKTKSGRDHRELGLEMRQLLRRFIDMCNAVAYAHSRGVLHRDLKPANVMLGPYGETLVVDWGLAKVLGELECPTGVEAPLALSDSNSSEQTQQGSIVGSPAYMSPEQAAGKIDQLGPASDIYSLGATLYYLLTGRTPFFGATLDVLLARVGQGQFPRPRSIDPSVPPALEGICLKAMAPVPEQRYQSATTLARDIEQWLADEPVTAFREPWLQRMGRWVRHHQALVAGIGALLLTSVVALTISTVVIRKEHQVTALALKNEGQARTERALAQVEQLRNAAAPSVPAILDSLRPFRDDILPRLRQLWEEDTAGQRVGRMRVGLALLPVEPERVKEQLAAWMLETDDPREMLLVRDGLVRYKDELKEHLWEIANRAESGREKRFRALAALAAFDAANPRWHQAAPFVVGELLAVNQLHLGVWAQALAPVRNELITPLTQVFRHPRPGDQRVGAATILASYAEDQPELLADLQCDGDPRQFAVLLPLLRKESDKTIKTLRGELQRTLEPVWRDPPLDPAWPGLHEDVVRLLTDAGGLVSERFAFCQTLPRERADSVLESLRGSGYRPICYRPFTRGGTVQVAAAWTRDAVEWQLAQDLTAEALRQQDETRRGRGYVPLDMTAYHAGGPGKETVAYACVWVRKGVETQAARMYVGVTGSQLVSLFVPLEREGFVPRTQTQVVQDGRLRHSAIWWQPATPFAVNNYNFSFSLDEYKKQLVAGHFQVEVRRVPPSPRVPTRQRFGEALVEIEQELKARPGEVEVLLRRAVTHCYLGQNDRALADLNAVTGKAPRIAEAYRFRALVHARGARCNEATTDLAMYLRLSQNTRLQTWLDLVVSATCGDDLEALARLDAVLAARPQDAELLYLVGSASAVVSDNLAGHNVVRAAAVFSGLAGVSRPVDAVLPVLVGQAIPGKVERRKVYADRAVALLRRAVAVGFNNHPQLFSDPFLDPIRAHPGLVELLKQLPPDDRYSAVWHNSDTLAATELHGLDAEAHLARCRALAADGWRPAALSVTANGPGSPQAASVWHRPVVPDAARDALARRQANAAVALVHLGQPEAAWLLLQHGRDPRVRTYLVHRLAALGIDARTVAAWLESERDDGARQALILSLGEYDADHLPADLWQHLSPRLLRWYRDDPDPGIHAAIDWLLRHGRDGPSPRPFDWQQAEALAKIDRELTGQKDDRRRWYVNPWGQSFVRFGQPIEFQMGSASYEPGRGDDEALHRRRIHRNFALAAKLLKVGEFQEFLNAHPEVEHTRTPRNSPDPDCPILAVTWYEAAQYCRWLSEKEQVPENQMCYPSVAEIEKCKDGKTPLKLPENYLSRTGYRLPTEAEWEYACRAGSVTRRFFGSDVEMLGKYAWYLFNSQDRSWPVGQKKPNDFGLFDMQGNAWQWCQESGWPYKPNPDGKPLGDEEDRRDVVESLTRALRGGSFLYQPANMRSAHRGGDRPSLRGSSVGFRLAQTLE